MAIDLEQLVEQISEVFSKSALADFKSFLADLPPNDRWMVASDYSLTDKKRVSDVFSFTLIPYSRHFSEITLEIKKAVSRDLKKARNISEDAVLFFRSSSFFHVSFVIPRKRRILNPHEKITSRGEAYNVINNTIDELRKSGKEGPLLASLLKWRQDAAANSFDIRLFENVLLASSLAAFLSGFLAKHASSTGVGWFSDRDSITTTGDSVALSLFHENTRYLSRVMGFDATLLIGMAVPEKEGKTWYDELIRPADYFAGVLSRWDPATGRIPGHSPKYEQFLFEIVTDNPRVVIIELPKLGDCIQCRRLLLKKVQL